MTLDEYIAEFDRRRSAIEFGDSLFELSADVTPTSPPSPAPWSLCWELRIGSTDYIRIREHYIALRGGATRRAFFSFHYGPLPAPLENGMLPPISPADSFHLRVCYSEARADAHIHYGGEDHISQDRVEGLLIKDLEWPMFVQAAISHQAGVSNLSNILGFTVIG